MRNGSAIMPNHKLESLISSNVGHVFAAIGLASALESRGGRISWRCADAPSYPTLAVDADDSTVDGAILEAVQSLFDDWQTILSQCFTRATSKIAKGKKDNEEPEAESAWIGCAREALYAVFDGLPPRLRARLAPWVSMIAVDPKDARYASKPRNQLSKTKFSSFFTSALLEDVAKVKESVGLLECLVNPLSYLESIPWSTNTMKTGYDTGSTMRDGGKPQSTVGATMAHPLVEALILLGIEIASLSPSTRMPRSRITKRSKTGEELLIPLWINPLSLCEIEAYLYNARVNEVCTVPFVDNGKNIVPVAGKYRIDRRKAS
jgi:hypothetical protein